MLARSKKLDICIKNIEWCVFFGKKNHLRFFPESKGNFQKKRDNFRFQLNQMVVDQATFESVDIPHLYAAGYIAQGTGLSVIGFHAGCFLIAGDILSKSAEAE